MSGISMLSRSHERSQNFNQEKAPYSRLYVHTYVPSYDGGGGGGGAGWRQLRRAYRMAQTRLLPDSRWRFFRECA